MPDARQTKTADLQALVPKRSKMSEDVPASAGRDVFNTPNRQQPRAISAARDVFSTRGAYSVILLLVPGSVDASGATARRQPQRPVHDLNARQVHRSRMRDHCAESTRVNLVVRQSPGPGARSVPPATDAGLHSRAQPHSLGTRPLLSLLRFGRRVRTPAA